MSSDGPRKPVFLCDHAAKTMPNVTEIPYVCMRRIPIPLHDNTLQQEKNSGYFQTMDVGPEGGVQ